RIRIKSIKGGNYSLIAAEMLRQGTNHGRLEELLSKGPFDKRFSTLWTRSITSSKKISSEEFA
ncbi:hypothetical protein PENTCL1PPCAC_2901, partial [Pristionchus entomophagus]